MNLFLYLGVKTKSEQYIRTYAIAFESEILLIQLFYHYNYNLLKQSSVTYFSCFLWQCRRLRP